MSTINAATGLPHLPVGYYWRVYKSDKYYHSYGRYFLGIFHKNWFVDRLMVVSGLADAPCEAGRLQALIKSEAPWMVNRLNTKLQEKRQVKITDQLLGNYPPKRI